MKRAVLAAIGSACFAGSAALAQSPEDSHDPFSVKFGIEVVPQYTMFRQDEASRQQVGDQEDEGEMRLFRLSARGHFDLFRRWNYVASYEYKGFDQTSDRDWSFSETRISTELPGIGTLALGKMKEPYIYEVVGDSVNLPQLARWLDPFFTGRMFGVRLAGQLPEEAGTWAIGWYNDWWTQGDSFSRSGNDFAARMTWLPLWQDDGRTFMHLAASVRYVGADDDILRFKGRPAAHVADTYVDTGEMPADHAWNLGLEALFNHGPYSLIAEYAHSDVRSAPVGNPAFSGYYVIGNWFVTGDSLPYDRKLGLTRRIKPKHSWGAIELTARFGRVDLDDGAIAGGTMNGWWFGVNWWSREHWRASVVYGNVDLDRFGLVGNTETLTMRLQWIFL